MKFLEASWILGLVSAYTYFMMGRYEAQNSSRANHGPVWALLSILLTVAVIEGLAGGWQAVLVAQVLFFAAITGWRFLFDK